MFHMFTASKEVFLNQQSPDPGRRGGRELLLSATCMRSAEKHKGGFMCSLCQPFFSESALVEVRTSWVFEQVFSWPWCADD